MSSLIAYPGAHAVQLSASALSWLAPSRPPTSAMYRPLLHRNCSHSCPSGLTPRLTNSPFPSHAHSTPPERAGSQRARGSHTVSPAMRAPHSPLPSGCSVCSAEPFTGGKREVFTIATRPTDRTSRLRITDPRITTSTFEFVTLSSASRFGAPDAEENVLKSRATLPPAATIAHRAFVWLSAVTSSGGSSSREHVCRSEGPHVRLNQRDTRALDGTTGALCRFEARRTPTVSKRHYLKKSGL